MSFRPALLLAEQYPHTFTLQYPPRREFFQERYRSSAAPPGLRDARQVLLYVHVPFCEAKCSYCNFAVDVRQQEPLHQRYVEGLQRQLEGLLRAVPEAIVPGIDIGGGTPTLLTIPLLEHLLASLRPWRQRATVPHPVSIETTPRIAVTHPERLALLADGGVDRISLGLQSSNEEVLARVNREHQAALALQAVEGLRLAGFRRVNVDLIFGLPGQTAVQWQQDLECVLAMPVDSVTTYDCLYRGKGRLFSRNADYPDPEVYGAFYDQAYQSLTAAGFHAPYGSVNFCRHAGETGTSPYFEGRLLDGLPYLGTGNYASSLLGDCWWFAPYRVGDWLKAVEGGQVLPARDLYWLPADERMAKYLLLSLSFGALDPGRFRRCFGVELKDSFGPALTYALGQGWLTRSGEVFGITPGAFRHLPKVRSLFYSEAAVAWLGRQTPEHQPGQTGGRRSLGPVVA
jgi:oxygen-independent coproporphyrinogen III oxidase